MITTVEKITELESLNVDSSTIVVHSGVFHAHDVFCSIYFKNVIRTRNADVIRTCLEYGAEVWDVGMGIDGCNDHHERGFVFDNLSQMFPEDMVNGMPWQTDLLDSIARIDNGLESIDYVSSMISSFNPCWNENNSPEAYDYAFSEALSFAKMAWKNSEQFISLKMRELSREAGKAEAASIMDKAMFDSAGSCLLKLNMFVPWQEKVVSYNQLAHETNQFGFIWVLFPSPDGQWRVQAVPKTADSFEFISPVGAKPEDEGFVFCHPNKFICGYHTKEQAIKAVRSW